ncbi:oxidoreductase C-terminal domain-containing protein, partial [Streptomyces antimycoticus]|uniref:oxidoreductase C-terminal domain-containing protein n=1 Tax=Streptomyces antimycoticus TaxID=68175 RepID=UPI0023EC9BF5
PELLGPEVGHRVVDRAGEVGGRPAPDHVGGHGARPLQRVVPVVHQQPRAVAGGREGGAVADRYGTRLLVHHWDNALQGPRTVAANVVGSRTAAHFPGAVYDPVPYFWSEQFGRFVQYAGHHSGADELVWRG